jgi:hypothetical protein
MPVGQAVTATMWTGSAAPSGALASAAGVAGLGRGGCRSRRGGVVGRLDHSAHQGDDGVGVGGLPQLLDVLLLDQGAGQLGEQLHVVLAGPLGAADHEDQVGGAVGAAPFDRPGQPGEAQGGLVDRRRAAVRDGEPAGHAGGSQGLPLEGIGGEAVPVGPAGPSDHGGQGGDDLLLRGAEIGVENDEFRIYE